MKIIVLGYGLVPRVGGLAPIRAPFDADENLVRLILGQGNLKPYMVKNDGSKVAVTYQNFKSLFAKENAPVVTAPKNIPVMEKKEPYYSKRDKKKHSNNNNYQRQEYKPVVESTPVVEEPVATTEPEVPDVIDFN